MAVWFDLKAAGAEDPTLNRTIQAACAQRCRLVCTQTSRRIGGCRRLDLSTSRGRSQKILTSSLVFIKRKHLTSNFKMCRNSRQMYKVDFFFSTTMSFNTRGVGKTSIR